MAYTHGPKSTTVRPQDDYFLYMNEGWLAAHPIPPTESRWSTFDVLLHNALDAQHAIMTELLARPTPSLSPNEQVLQTFITSQQHKDTHQAQNKKEVAALLESIAAAASHHDIARCIGMLHRYEIGPFWRPYDDLDNKDSSVQILLLQQGGLTLPNRDYYLEDASEMQKIRSAFREYFAELHSALAPSAPLNFDTVYKLEESLASASWTDVALRDAEKNYHRLTLNAAKAELPGIDWDAYFTGLGWKTPNDHIVVGQYSYLQSVSQLLLSAPLDELKQYLAWRVLNALAAFVSEELGAISFRFHGTTLQGQKERRPLWQRILLMIDGLELGEAFGKLYAEKHFPEASRQAVLSMVEDIRAAYHARIDRLDWMSDVTKRRAHAKLDAITVLIGYPNEWRDFSGLQLHPETPLRNILSARAFDTDIMLARPGTPPEQERWHMTPQTVNAYNEPNRLEIAFPAAILQPPFYDPEASYAMNLGGIGSVIGHEFTHSFDDEGSKFDENGEVNPWYTPAERSAFTERANWIVTQGDTFEVLPEVRLQGALILGESIADLGGLELALEALAAHHGGTAPKAELVDLFEHYAMIECGHNTPERALQLAKNDPHPPSAFRVNAILAHIDRFYEAYGLKETDGLYRNPNERSRIW